MSAERVEASAAPLRLDIGGVGGAGKRGDEYTSVDVAEGADVQATMWELPFAADSVEEIWSSHSLEHVPAGKVAPTLREWLRVLRPGARAIIQVPSFDYVAKYWLTGPDRQWAEAMIFGTQANEGEFHKCAFTAAILRADCEVAGFEVKRVEMRWSHNQETLQAVCVKRIKPPEAPGA